MEPGARVAFWIWVMMIKFFHINCLTVLSFLFLWGVKGWCLKRSNAKGMDLGSEDVAWVPPSSLIILHMVRNNPGLYRTGAPTISAWVSPQGSKQTGKRALSYQLQGLHKCYLWLLLEWLSCLLELELVSDDSRGNELCVLLQVSNVQLINGTTTGLACWTLSILT